MTTATYRSGSFGGGADLTVICQPDCATAYCDMTYRVSRCPGPNLGRLRCLITGPSFNIILDVGSGIWDVSMRVRNVGRLGGVSVARGLHE